MFPFVTLLLLWFAAICGAEDDACTLPEQSMPLIQWGVKNSVRDQNMHVVSETIDVLSSMDGPVVVISVVGQYRTGKSFMINQLIKASVPLANNVFKVGSSVQPETEDVNVFIIPACASAVAGTAIFVVDTPGLFAPNRHFMFDIHILALTTLLSDVMLFNSKYTVDRAIIEQLGKTVQQARALVFSQSHQLRATLSPLEATVEVDEQLEASEDEGAGLPNARQNQETPDLARKEVSLDRPHLIFTVQDFQLKLRDSSGLAVSPKQWLWTILASVDAVHEDKPKGADFTGQFMTFFSSVGIATLPQPAPALEDIELLETLRSDQLGAGYVSALNTLSARLLSLVSSKALRLVNGASMSSSELAAMVVQWVGVFAESEAHLQSEESFLAHIFERETSLGVINYAKQMMQVPFPVHHAELLRLHAAAQAACLTDEQPSYVTVVTAATNQKLRLYEGMNDRAYTETMTEALNLFREEVGAVFEKLPMPDRVESIANAGNTLEEMWLKDVKLYASLLDVDSPLVRGATAEALEFVRLQVATQVENSRLVLKSALEVEADAIILLVGEFLGGIEVPVAVPAVISLLATFVAQKMEAHEALLNMDDVTKEIVMSQFYKQQLTETLAFTERNEQEIEKQLEVRASVLERQMTKGLRALALPISASALRAEVMGDTRAVWARESADLYQLSSKTMAELEADDVFTAVENDVMSAAFLANEDAFTAALAQQHKASLATLEASLKLVQLPAARSSFNPALQIALMDWDFVTLLARTEVPARAASARAAFHTAGEAALEAAVQRSTAALLAALESIMRDTLASVDGCAATTLVQSAFISCIENLERAWSLDVDSYSSLNRTVVREKKLAQLKVFQAAGHSLDSRRTASFYQGVVALAFGLCVLTTVTLAVLRFSQWGVNQAVLNARVFRNHRLRTVIVFGSGVAVLALVTVAVVAWDNVNGWLLVISIFASAMAIPGLALDTGLSRPVKGDLDL